MVPCSQATSLQSCRIGVTSALCEAIQISFRSERRRSAASSKESNLSHSSRFMAAGGKRTFSRMLKRQLRDLPNGICAGSARGDRKRYFVNPNCAGSCVGCSEEMQATRLPLLSFDQLIYNSRQSSRGRLAHEERCKSRERRFLRIHFDEFAVAIAFGPECPIDNVSKNRRGSG